MFRRPAGSPKPDERFRNLQQSDCGAARGQVGDLPFEFNMHGSHVID
jgi:hypothetical protein